MGYLPAVFPIQGPPPCHWAQATARFTELSVASLRNWAKLMLGGGAQRQGSHWTSVTTEDGFGVTAGNLFLSENDGNWTEVRKYKKNKKSEIEAEHLRVSRKEWTPLPGVHFQVPCWFFGGYCCYFDVGSTMVESHFFWLMNGKWNYPPAYTIHNCSWKPQELPLKRRKDPVWWGGFSLQLYWLKWKEIVNPMVDLTLVVGMNLRW